MEALAPEEGAGVPPEGERISHLDKPGHDLRPDDTDELEKYKEFLGEPREDLTDPNMEALNWGELDAEGFRDERESQPDESYSAEEPRRPWRYVGCHRAPRRPWREVLVDWWDRIYAWFVGL